MVFCHHTRCDTPWLKKKRQIILLELELNNYANTFIKGTVEKQIKTELYSTKQETANYIKVLTATQTDNIRSIQQEHNRSRPLPECPGSCLFIATSWWEFLDLLMLWTHKIFPSLVDRDAGSIDLIFIFGREASFRTLIDKYIHRHTGHTDSNSNNILKKRCKNCILMDITGTMHNEHGNNLS